MSCKCASVSRFVLRTRRTLHGRDMAPHWCVSQFDLKDIHFLLCDSSAILFKVLRFACFEANSLGAQYSKTHLALGHRQEAYLARKHLKDLSMEGPGFVCILRLSYMLHHSRQKSTTTRARSAALHEVVPYFVNFLPGVQSALRWTQGWAPEWLCKLLLLSPAPPAQGSRAG